MYVTTPIYYATERPHVGHTFTTLLADILARAAITLRGGTLMRADLTTGTILEDGDVFFLTGTDEHGSKVAAKAAAAGKDPKTFVDGIAAEYQATWALMGIEPSAFIQTSNPLHEKVVQDVAQRMLDRGDITKGTFIGLYCPDCEGFKTKTELTEDGLCPDHKKPPQALEEENYFFRLSAYQQRVLAYHEAHAGFLSPANRRNEVLSFLRTQELQDLSISRLKTNVPWGVTLPFNEEHTMYVWIDALFNYVSALRILGPEIEARFWPAQLHLMAKEITRFHAIYWPAFLESEGLAMPEHVVAHGWFTVDGQKMSKTLGNTVYAEDLVARFGRDATRYLLATSMQLDSDGDISLERWHLRYVSELANGFGNLVNRVVTLAAKYLEGAPYEPLDESLAPDAGQHIAAARKAYEDADVLRAAEEAFRLIDRGNKLADETKVWALAKEDPARFAVVMGTLNALTMEAARLLTPLMPEKGPAALAALEQRTPAILFPRLES